MYGSQRLIVTLFQRGTTDRLKYPDVSFSPGGSIRDPPKYPQSNESNDLSTTTQQQPGDYFDSLALNKENSYITSESLERQIIHYLKRKYG